MITFEYQRVTIADVEWENPSLSAKQRVTSWKPTSYPLTLQKLWTLNGRKKSAGITNIPQRNCDNTKNPKNE